MIYIGALTPVPFCHVGMVHSIVFSDGWLCEMKNVSLALIDSLRDGFCFYMRKL